jgi:hypothetical protein
MNADARREEVRALRATRQDIAELVRRYPHVSDAEARQIVTFLRTGRHLDVGMLAGDDTLKPQLDRFMTDHAKDLRVGFWEGSAVIATIAGFLGLCWLVWEAVKPAALAA